MGGSASKNKGSGFERDLCKIMSGVFGGSFIRSESSGAYIGRTNSHRKETLSVEQIRSKKSDIQTPSHMPKLVIEAKAYKDFRFHQLMQPGACTQLDTWVQQCLETVDAGDFWFIVFKINRRGMFVAIPEQFTNKMAFQNHSQYEGNKGKLFITELEQFLTNNKDEILRLSI